MAGHKISMQMRFDDVGDPEVMALCGLEIDFDVALRVYDCSDPVGSDQIRGVREAPQVELLKYHPRTSAV
jgi:hypothetical protein